MALDFTDLTTDRINHGTALGSGFTSATWAWWYYPTALNTSRGIATLNDASNFSVPGLLVGAVSADELRMSWRRAGGGANMAYETNNANITVNKWWFVCATVDQAAAAGTLVKFYVGDLSTLATLCTNGVTTDPSSGFLTNSGATFYTGDNGAATTAMGGCYAVMMFWPNVVLTEPQARLQQEAMLYGRGPIVGGCRLWAKYGLQGTLFQNDFSGYGNHGTGTGVSMAVDPPVMRQARRRRVAHVRAWRFPRGMHEMPPRGIPIPIPYR